MDRRRFVTGATGMGMSLALGSSFWERALGAPAQPGESPYGPLQPADGNGLQVPAGFTTRVVARALQPVAGTTYLWHVFPDGGACVPTDDGGWIYVSNSENPPPDIPVPAGVPTPGGVSAIRFDADGTVVDAYSVLSGSRSNCAGGLTPWGTWLSCEEWEEANLPPFGAGQVWECDPFGGPAVARPSLGRFKHEMAAVDPVRHHVYLSEDQDDGLLYRYTPPGGAWGSGAALDGGAMEAMAVDAGGAVTWLPVANAAAPTVPLRRSVPGATAFQGGEGLVHDDGRVYLTTKRDHRVWVHDVEAQTMSILYNGGEFGAGGRVLAGVDNILVSLAHDLYVAEDGDNMEVCIITPELVVAPVVRMPGPEHGIANATPIPTASEVTGLALSPDGNRLYLNSQRGFGGGILYEVTGPFRGGTLAAGGASGPSGPSASPGAPPAGPMAPLPAAGRSGGEPLARTGGTSPGWWAAAAAVGAAAVARRFSSTRS